MAHPGRRFTQAEELLLYLADLIQDYSTFWSLCLVNRAFYRIFRKYLWDEIVWDSRSDVFFNNRIRLALFLDRHRGDLVRAHTLRGVRLSEASSSAGGFPCLASMEIMQSHMPNLKTYE